MTMAVSPLNADPPRYRLVDITEIGFLPLPDSIGTMGMNNKGQVVYTRLVGENYRAWVWLPNYPWMSGVDYSLNPGLHELNSTGDAIAHDININGIVAGQSDGNQGGLGEATVWTLGSSITSHGLGYLGGIQPWSKAWAINDDPDPTVVGDSTDAGQCCILFPDPPSEDTPVIKSFRIVFDSPLGSMSSCAPPADTNATYGRDIPANSVLGGYRVAGIASCDRTGQCLLGPTCGEAFFSEAISCVSGATVHSDFGDVGSPALKISSAVRGINNAVESVGWGFVDHDDCLRKALFWSSPSAAFVDLGNTMPPEQSGEGRRAEAINNISPPQVVGWNTEQALGVLWEYSGSAWAATNLTDEIGTCPGWVIEQAHDINDDGWIIAYGTYGTDPREHHAILLIPYNAVRADIDGGGLRQRR
jgi:hypothetical protein